MSSPKTARTAVIVVAAVAVVVVLVLVGLVVRSHLARPAPPVDAYVAAVASGDAAAVLAASGDDSWLGGSTQLLVDDVAASAGERIGDVEVRPADVGRSTATYTVSFTLAGERSDAEVAYDWVDGTGWVLVRGMLGSLQVTTDGGDDAPFSIGGVAASADPATCPRSCSAGDGQPFTYALLPGTYDVEPDVTGLDAAATQTVTVRPRDVARVVVGAAG